jgi:hypothetical protein
MIRLDPMRANTLYSWLREANTHIVCVWNL